MQYNIKEIIHRLNEQRKTVQFRHKTLDSENKQNCQSFDNKRRLSTLDPPSMSMQFLELDIMKQQESKEIKKVLNKKLLVSNHKRAIANTMKRKELNIHLPKIDLQQLNHDPLPIIYPKQEKMVKLRKVSSRIVDSSFDYYVY